MGDVDHQSLKEELETCKHFWLTVRWRMEDTESTTFPWILRIQNVLEKLDFVFDCLKCAAKLNVAFGFELKNGEDGSCR